MREIKFEYLLLLKNKHDITIEKVIYTLEQLEEIEMEIILEEKQAEIIARRQYTGLKDKNGVEIYEGDIVKDEGSYYGDQYIYIYRKIVFGKTLDNRYGWYACDSNNEIQIVFMDKIEQLEVVGNIYENPDLIKI